MPHPKFLPIVALSFVMAMLPACSPSAKKARFTERAERYFKAGQYDQAKIEYLNVLQIDPGNAHAYARSGAIWLAEGAPLRAGGFLLRAVELSPNDFESRVNLARVYLAMGRTADAVKEALTVSEKAPDNGPALLVLADAVQKKDDLDAMEARLEKLPRKDSISYHLATAGMAGKKGDLVAADAALQRALAADPKSPTVHSALAVLALARKDLKNAATEFQRAADLSPVRSNEWIRLAQFKMQTQAVEEAKTILKNLTDKAPDFFPAWNLRARIANEAKKPDEALTLLQNVLSRDPANLDARLVQTVSWAAKGEKKKAIDSLEDLNRTYADTPIVKYQLARAYLAESRIDQAIGELDRVVHISPGFVDAIVLRSELQLRKHNAQAAVEPLLAVLKAQPMLGSAQVLLAEAYRMLGRFDEAANLIQEQIKQSPKAAAAYYLLGLILEQQGKLPEARQAFEKSAELAPDNPTSLDRLVELEIASKAFAAGEQRVDQLLQKQPNSAAGHYLKGKLSFAQNNFDSAQAELLKSIDLDPNFTRAYDLLGPTLTQTKKLSDSLNQMKAVLAKNPNDVAALSIAGMIDAKLGDYDKARAGYEKILTLKPDFVPALNNLAYIYAEKLNDLNRAGELAQKARTLAPDDPSVADTMGWILFKQGDYQQAVGLFEQSVGKSPDDGEAQYHLGLANYMMGRSEAARAALKKAFSAPGDFTGKAEAGRRLALLDRVSAGTLSTADLEEILKQQPNDPVALMRLGESYEKAGAISKAEGAYERAFKGNPRLVAAAVKLAELNAAALKNPTKALEYARKARELAPADPRVEAMVGRVALRAGNYTWAYNLLQESARQLRDDSAVLQDLAWAAYSVGKVSEARQTMQRLIDSAPAAQQIAAAKTFLRMTDGGEPGVSETEIKSVLAEDAGYVPAIVARGRLELHRGDFKSAEATFREVLARFPEFAPAQRDLAACLVEDPNRLPEAYDLATKVRRILPNDPDLQRVLGLISYSRKEFGRAIQLLEQSNSQKPLDTKSLYYLGMAQVNGNHKSEARETLKRAIEGGLAEPIASEARRVLTDLNKS